MVDTILNVWDAAAVQPIVEEAGGTFTDWQGNKIGRITTAGAITEFAVRTPGAGPDGIVAGPDGNLWFSEAHLSRVGRITPKG